MPKMYIGPHQAADLRNTGRWDPDTMTTDKAAAESGKRVDTCISESTNAPMRAPVDSEIIMPGGADPSSATHPHVDAAPQERDSVSAPLLSVSDIAARLNESAADVARELLGTPNAALSTNKQLRFGTKGSLAVEINGPKCGRWYDHENGEGGDALELVMRQQRVALGDALHWARRWLGLSFATAAPARDEDSPPAASTEDETEKGPSRVQEILSASVSVSGTAAELYLRRRGIAATPPDAIRYRARAFGRYGALVALAADSEGNVLAVQQVYLTDDGRKAPLPVQKRTNKAVDGWSEKAAMRLPGHAPIILCEGPETALS